MPIHPSTVAVIAQAGAQLFSLVAGRGGGSGRLMAAQVEMLRQLGAQLSVLNAQLDAMYKDIQWVKEMTGRLPKDTVREFIGRQSHGHLRHAEELLRTHADDQADHGQEYARLCNQKEAEKLLYDINAGRQMLISEANEALCPLACALWHIELLLRVTCVEFHENRIVSMAEDYAAALNHWLTDVIRPKLEETNDKLAAQHDAIVRSEKYRDHCCYGPPSLSAEFRGHGGGSHGGGGVEYTIHTLSASRVAVTARPSPVREALAAYRAELATLASLGFTAGPVYEKIAPYVWSQRSELVRHDEKGLDRVPASLVKLKAEMLKEACSVADFGPRFVENENKRAAWIEEHFADTVVYGYFLVTCLETQRSVQGILVRAAQPTE